MKKINCLSFSNLVILHLVLLFLIKESYSHVLRRWPRSRQGYSYLANDTACTVDDIVYREGDSIPTGDPCEVCRCRPPGFHCIVRDCPIKPGCRAIRREGECCHEYQCGCEYNGKYFNDGDTIPFEESRCYACICQGSSITCSLLKCEFRMDCEPEYIPGECCPRYDHCRQDTNNTQTDTSEQFDNSFDSIMLLGSTTTTTANYKPTITSTISDAVINKKIPPTKTNSPDMDKKAMTIQVDENSSQRVLVTQTPTPETKDKSDVKIEKEPLEKSKSNLHATINSASFGKIDTHDLNGTNLSLSSLDKTLSPSPDATTVEIPINQATPVGAHSILSSNTFGETTGVDLMSSTTTGYILPTTGSNVDPTKEANSVQIEFVGNDGKVMTTTSNSSSAIASSNYTTTLTTITTVPATSQESSRNERPTTLSSILPSSPSPTATTTTTTTITGNNETTLNSNNNTKIMEASDSTHNDTLLGAQISPTSFAPATTTTILSETANDTTLMTQKSTSS